MPQAISESGMVISQRLLKIPDQMPEISLAELKPPQQFRLIGASVPRRDVPAKNKTALPQYAIDIQLPGMLYGMIHRSPVHNDRPGFPTMRIKIRTMKGVHATVPLNHGIGVIGNLFYGC